MGRLFHRFQALFMDTNHDSARLSQISTMWQDLARAHDFTAHPDRQELGALLERYHRAVFRYLCAVTGKEDVAADMFQEFAVMFLEGKFHYADSSKGRFRDYLKTALLNLIRKDFNRAARILLKSDSVLDLQPGEVPDDSKLDDLFFASWRKTLLDRAWENLAAIEMKTGTPYHTVLKTHSENAALSSAELARHLTTLLRPTEPFTDVGIRKLLQRGRKTMAELLVREIARSIPTENWEIIEQELIALGFHSHCRDALTDLRASGELEK